MNFILVQFDARKYNLMYIPFGSKYKMAGAKGTGILNHSKMSYQRIIVGAHVSLTQKYLVRNIHSEYSEILDRTWAPSLIFMAKFGKLRLGFLFL